MKKKLYNVIFPIWFLMMFPMSWIFVLPANFIIDTIVFFIALKVFKITTIKEQYKKCIFKIWIFGFIADMLGSVILLLTQFFPSEGILKDITIAATINPFQNIYGFLYVAIATFVSAVAIYLFNQKIALKKADIDEKTKKKIALILAIVTAPYVFFFPAKSLYDQSIMDVEGNLVEEQIICEYVVDR